MKKIVTILMIAALLMITIPIQALADQGSQPEVVSQSSQGSNNYKEVIVHHVRDQIIKNPNVYFKEAMETVKDFTDEQPFYITPKGIVVVYGLYEIAPYAAGIQEFLVPFSAFQCS
jgi:ABC-type Fe3+-hydroxamate transport system substrate-binding protein